MKYPVIFSETEPPKVCVNGVEEPLISVTDAVNLIRQKEGYERFDGSTLRKHCTSMNFGERVKWGLLWYVYAPAIWPWLEENYPKPRIKYTKKSVPTSKRVR